MSFAEVFQPFRYSTILSLSRGTQPPISATRRAIHSTYAVRVIPRPSRFAVNEGGDALVECHVPAHAASGETNQGDGYKSLSNLSRHPLQVAWRDERLIVLLRFDRVVVKRFLRVHHCLVNGLPHGDNAGEGQET